MTFNSTALKAKFYLNFKGAVSGRAEGYEASANALRSHNQNRNAMRTNAEKGNKKTETAAAKTAILTDIKFLRKKKTENTSHPRPLLSPELVFNENLHLTENSSQAT